MNCRAFATSSQIRAIDLLRTGAPSSSHSASPHKVPMHRPTPPREYQTYSLDSRPRIGIRDLRIAQARLIKGLNNARRTDRCGLKRDIRMKSKGLKHIRGQRLERHVILPIVRRMHDDVPHDGLSAMLLLQARDELF